MTDAQYAEDLKVMIQADMGHMIKHLSRGDRVLAHQFVDSIIDNTRELENVLRKMGQTIDDREALARVLANVAAALLANA